MYWNTVTNSNKISKFDNCEEHSFNQKNIFTCCFCTLFPWFKWWYTYFSCHPHWAVWKTYLCLPVNLLPKYPGLVTQQVGWEKPNVGQIYFQNSNYTVLKGAYFLGLWVVILFLMIFSWVNYDRKYPKNSLNSLMCVKTATREYIPYFSNELCNQCFFYFLSISIFVTHQSPNSILPVQPGKSPWLDPHSLPTVLFLGKLDGTTNLIESIKLTCQSDYILKLIKSYHLQIYGLTDSLVLILPLRNKGSLCLLWRLFIWFKWSHY